MILSEEEVKPGPIIQPQTIFVEMGRVVHLIHTTHDRRTTNRARLSPQACTVGTATCGASRSPVSRRFRPSENVECAAALLNFDEHTLIGVIDGKATGIPALQWI